jgi:hypothetical protein
MVVANSAEDAAASFVSSEPGHIVGTISEIQGDRAAATAVAGDRLFVIFVERAAEAVQTNLGGPADPSRQRELH